MRDSYLIHGRNSCKNELNSMKKASSYNFPVKQLLFIDAMQWRHHKTYFYFCKLLLLLLTIDMKPRLLLKKAFCVNNFRCVAWEIAKTNPVKRIHNSNIKLFLVCFFSAFINFLHFSCWTSNTQKMYAHNVFFSLWCFCSANCIHFPFSSLHSSNDCRQFSCTTIHIDCI